MQTTLNINLNTREKNFILTMIEPVQKERFWFWQNRDWTEWTDSQPIRESVIREIK